MEKRLYLGDAWYVNDPKSEEEEKSGYISELRIMHFLFFNMILANTLGEKVLCDEMTSAIVDAYNDITEEYEDIYQYFIVDLALDEDKTAEILKAAGGLYLYYSEEYDLYVLGVGDLGTSRRYVMTNIKKANSYEEDNLMYV